MIVMVIQSSVILYILKKRINKALKSLKQIEKLKKVLVIQLVIIIKERKQQKKRVLMTPLKNHN